MKESYYSICRKRIKETAIRQGWYNSAGMVVALSGGGDSVAMLFLLKKFFPGRLVAVHLDHCTRNGKSHEDAEFARQLCLGWNIEFFAKTVNVEAQKQRGESFEMAARRVRYSLFENVATSQMLNYIAVGHTMDDVVETQLLNLFRGCGVDGLRGIPETRGKIVRPLVNFRRDELRMLLKNENINWAEDESNSENVYSRNKIRNFLIPWIKENINPNFEVSLAGLSEQISCEIKERDLFIGNLISKISVTVEPALACWNSVMLRELTDLQLADALRYQGALLKLPVLDRKRLLLLVALIRKGGRWRFQWASDIEVCHSKFGMGWIHRCDISKIGQNNTYNMNQKNIPWWV